MIRLFPDHSARHKPLLAVGFAAALLVTACSSKPDSYQPLNDLRAEVQKLRQTNLPSLAPTSFAEVEVALSRAEGALGDVEIEELRHLTALAEIRLATARAEGQTAAARAERDQLLEERRSILGRARQRELGAAQGEAPTGDEASALPPGPELNEGEPQ